MGDVSCERFSAAAKQMERAGFSDVEEEGNPLGEPASQSLSKLLGGIRRLLAMITAPQEVAISGVPATCSTRSTSPRGAVATRL